MLTAGNLTGRRRRAIFVHSRCGAALEPHVRVVENRFDPMELIHAQRLARELMDQHGLAAWSFGFDGARRRFGACWSKRRRITLSRPLTELNAWDEVRDTLLHEIAHALSPGGHTAAWRATCVRIGARPVRCFNPASVALPTIRRTCCYVAHCRCAQPHTRVRRPGRVYLCRTCRQKLAWQKVPSATRPALPAWG